MAKNSDRVELKIVTPRGTAIYPKLNTPDTKFDADGVYESKLKFDPAATDGVLSGKSASWESIVAAVNAQQEKFLADKKKELAAGDGKAKNKAKTITSIPWGEEPDVDDEGEATGLVVVKAKMKASGVSKKDKTPWTRSPMLFDAKNKKLSAGKEIWGGSELKIAGVVFPYYNAKDNVVGSSFRLEAVQVLELVSGRGRDAGAFGFGEEDGYVDEDAGPSAFEPDADGADGDANF